MKCAHCGAPNAPNRWRPQLCADKRRKRSKWLCDPCDILLNRLVMQFFRDPQTEQKIAAYGGSGPP